MPMDIEKVRRLLAVIALDRSAKKPDAAIQSIALALMQMAEGIYDLQTDVNRLLIR